MPYWISHSRDGIRKKYDFFIYSIIKTINHSINNKHKIKTIIIYRNIHSNHIYYNIVIVALTIKSYKIVESFSNDKPLKDNRMHTKFLKCSPSVLGARLFLHDLYYRVPMNIWINKNKNIFTHPTNYSIWSIFYELSTNHCTYFADLWNCAPSRNPCKGMPMSYNEISCC